MRPLRTAGFWTSALACMGLLLPISTLPAQGAVPPSAPAAPAPKAAAPPPVQIDVALRDGGTLMGQVVTANGVPVAQSPVSVRLQGREVAKAVTDRFGYFVVRGLRGGLCEVTCGRARGTVRAWAPGTAPPVAQAGVLLVEGGQPIRGQSGPLGYWLGKPWVIAGVVAAAVAIPVAIHNHRVHRSSSP
jgi:hypothetical protein